MEIGDVPYEAIVFVCTNARGQDGRVSCAGGGRCGAKLRDLLKEEAAARGLKGRVRVSASGCLDFCEEGPNVMVFTRSGGKILYKGVSEKDLPQIVENHFT
jgi:(2Fe-2S) ferredoxin